MQVRCTNLFLIAYQSCFQACLIDVIPRCCVAQILLDVVNVARCMYQTIVVVFIQARLELVICLLSLPSERQARSLNNLYLLSNQGCVQHRSVPEPCRCMQIMLELVINPCHCHQKRKLIQTHCDSHQAQDFTHCSCWWSVCRLLVDAGQSPDPQRLVAEGEH